MEGRVHGGDDIIATLSGRVTELSKRVALLQAELESATKRVAIYEEHDSTIQEALSGALRAAYQIRERAETTAEQILDQAREERRMLLKEIERLREERDSVQDEIATQRRSGIGPVASRSLTSDSVASELRSVASEALKGLFQEIVDDMRKSEPTRAAPEPPRA
ncbi:MAG: DivIVA domain-containing protein, partial [Candidatus Limnocylindria bacterium]|nr:DivIVA domain-containing protein [Candidatus Limnocylindria bacterium]